MVETSNTQMGAVVSDREVVQLPLNARDTYQIAPVAAGRAVATGFRPVLWQRPGRRGSVNGGRGRANNFTVNGGNANDPVRQSARHFSPRPIRLKNSV